jgi:hypothetical protein
MPKIAAVMRRCSRNNAARDELARLRAGCKTGARIIAKEF